MNKISDTLRDSGLFTRVESHVPCYHIETWINRNRGVLCKVHSEAKIDAARVWVDAGEINYSDKGLYNSREMIDYMFPVMRSTISWNKYIANQQGYDFSYFV